MKDFFVARLKDLLPTLFGISLISFFIIRMIPGDPVLLLLGERGADPVVYQEMKKELGLDKPMASQYVPYLGNALRGDFGKSIMPKREVSEEFWDRFPATLELGLAALFFAAVIGIPLGIISAIKKGSFLDFFFMTTSLVGYSMPIFWWGLILIMIFSVGFGLTPVSGRIDIFYEVPTITGFYLIDTLINPTLLKEEGLAPFFSAIDHLILPALAMGTIPLAVLARMTRSSMLEVLDEDYMRTATAKGLPPFRVIMIHGFRNALIPIITVMGLLFGSIVTGAILTETIFSWPGIGKWLVASINARDYPVIQGGVLFIASLIVFINLSIDFLSKIINPRLRSDDL